MCENMNLCDLFDLSFKGRRNQVALEFGADTYTFGDIDTRSNRLAQLLAGRGLRTGDRLAVYMANSVEMIDVFLACVKLGLIFVPINILYRDREITHILADAEPAALITDAEIHTNIPLWRPQDLHREAGACEDARPAAAADGDTPAGIIYTSGTTGTSKGAVLTHNNFAANAVNLLTCWEIRASRPFPAHAASLSRPWTGQRNPRAGSSAGCRMRLLERFDHQTAAANFLDFRPTLFFGVPTIYVRMLAFEAADSARDRIARAPLRFRLGAAARAGARRVSRPLRPHHPRALRHERNTHEHEQPLCGRATRRDGGTSPAGRLGAPAGPRSAACSRRRDRRSVSARPQRFPRLLETRGGDPRRLLRRLLPDGRPGYPLTGWLLHALGTAQRPDHLRGI